MADCLDGTRPFYSDRNRTGACSAIYMLLPYRYPVAAVAGRSVRAVRGSESARWACLAASGIEAWRVAAQAQRQRYAYWVCEAPPCCREWSRVDMPDVKYRPKSQAETRLGGSEEARSVADCRGGGGGDGVWYEAGTTATATATTQQQQDDLLLRDDNTLPLVYRNPTATGFGYHPRPQAARGAMPRFKSGRVRCIGC